MAGRGREGSIEREMREGNEEGERNKNGLRGGDEGREGSSIAPKSTERRPGRGESEEGNRKRAGDVSLTADRAVTDGTGAGAATEGKSSAGRLSRLKMASMSCGETERAAMGAAEANSGRERIPSSSWCSW